MVNSASFRKQLATALHAEDIEIRQALSGGDINEAYQISLSSGRTLFLKRNRQFKAHFFKAEAGGLAALRQSKSLRVPQVILVDYIEDSAVLVQEYIDRKAPSADYAHQLGLGLSALHRNTHPSFGWEKDNFIGSLAQNNTFVKDWPDFYAEYRILSQVRSAFDANLLSPKDLKMVESFLKAYPHLVPKEKPALLHGDLWSGNVISDEKGAPVWIDPAVYYGHREMDLAMMKLFGGFSEAVFSTYQEHFPLEANWQERIPYHQLYPLLVHLNLFGSSYYPACRQIWLSFA